MRKNIVRLALSAMLFALCGSVNAQQTGKIFRIGILDPSTASGSAVLLDAFRQELSKLGWFEGKNITIEYRFAENKRTERLPELAADLVRLKVDLIVASFDRVSVGGQERHYYHPHRDDERWGPRGCRFGCQSGAAGRQCHRVLGFIARAKYQKARDTQGRGPQSSRELDFCDAGSRRIRPPTERTQGCGSGTEAKIGGDRDSTRPQTFRERLSNRKAEAGGGDYDDHLGRRLFAERKRIVELAGKYRLPAIYPQKEFVEAGRSHVLRGGL